MRKALASAASATVFMVSVTTAEAGIVCHDGFQVVNGREISTPYCNDNYIAHVARQYGMKATDEQVRNNPALKDEICRFASSDIRIQNYCPDDHGGDKSR
jgi:hypothetical protein